ncbi:MAG: hypothetical protein HY287_00720 [Planctomycetes bacterium]|nr:hypothetical protein [Planctomycetota bacterium]MBI3832831.1 hypothetical protein [Planctomycetota bacterium]
MFQWRSCTLFVGLTVVSLSHVVHAEPEWLLRSETGPTPRTLHAMVWDSCRNVVVLFGGASDPAHRFGDTWEWNGTEWELRATNGPGPRLDHAMAFDSNRCVTVLFGGIVGDGNYMNDTWEWNGTSWTEKCTNGCTRPPTLASAGMTYDSSQHFIVMFGGYAPGLQNNTWTWNGTSWSRVVTNNSPAPRSSPAMGFDSVRQRTVLFGGNLVPVVCGTHSDETWELDLATATWTLIPTAHRPNPRGENSHLAFDLRSDGMILFGGTDFCTTSYADTWEFNGADWIPVTTPIAPPGRHGHDMVYDAIRQEVVLFGGDLGPLSNWIVSGQTWTLTESETDSDHDGIPDADDQCPDSDLNATVVISACNSGVNNHLFDSGCSMMDEIAQCQANAHNHGQFVSCVTALVNEWRAEGLITGREGSRITRCAAQSKRQTFNMTPLPMEQDPK